MSFSATDTLLVPMGLKAMVMPAQDQNAGQGWDTRPLDYAQINNYLSPVPRVFGETGLSGTGTPPESGVHLYWTLPRALTTALSQSDIDTATAAGSPPPAGVTPYPYVPNRWLVLRMRETDPDTSTETGPEIAAWVINADETDPTGKGAAYVNPFASGSEVVEPLSIGVARPLADWQALAEGAGFDLPPRPFLTALGPGNATFNAFTPGSANVFSFCDPLTDNGAPIDSATLSYAVLGWFEEAACDPLSPANPLNGDTIWSAVDPAALPTDAPAQTEGLSWVPRLRWLADLGNAPAPTRSLLQALIAGVQWNRNAPLPEPPEFSDFSSTAQNVRVALAETSAEGLSAMAYEALDAAGHSDAARLALELEALQYHALRDLDSPGGRHALADRIKQAAYATTPGGTLWEVLGVEGAPAVALTDAQAESLAALNRSQRAADEARAVLGSMQGRLYDLWWQQQSIALSNFAPSPSNPGYFQLYLQAQQLLTVPRGAQLSPPVAAYQQQVQAQEQAVAALEAEVPDSDDPDSIAVFAAGFLDPVSQRLVPMPAPGFFAPTDPVLVVAGAGSLSDPQPRAPLCRRAPVAGSTGALPQAAAALAETGAAELEPSAWQQPWAPLFLDWQVRYTYTPTPGPAAGNTALTPGGHYAINQAAWHFDGRDYRWQGGAYGQGSFQAAYATSYEGRTFVSPHAKRTLSRQVQATETETGQAPNPDMAARIEDWSLVSQSTSGLLQQLAMRDISANAAPGAAIAADMPEQLQGVPAPWLNPTPHLQDNQTGNPFFFPLRAGFLTVTGLQLTDSFGRTMNLLSANHGSLQEGAALTPVLPPALTPPSSAGTGARDMALLSPRLVQPARLAFRLVDANDDTAETVLSAGANPICGWLLPNHADASLAVYDQSGGALGALQSYLLSGGDRVLQWIPAPGGDSAPSGPAAPQIANAQLSAMVQGLLDANDPAAALEDLMRTLDQAAWTLDPGEDRARGSLGALMGHPVALVRANLQLQLQGLPMANQSIEQIFEPGGQDLRFSDGGVTDLTFQLRLGGVELRRDGIAGFYAGSDYSALTAVHRPAGTTSGYVTAQGESDWLSLAPVPTPEASDGTMQTEGSAWVTLLVDPRGEMTLTSGLLPRVRRPLPEAQVEAALSAMELSIQVGPLLLDRQTLRMPLPSVPGGSWSWLEATGTAAGDWQSNPVVSADASARPLTAPPALTDGWLMLRPAGPDTTDD